MCGIIGYIGNKEAQPIIINGLKKLEYRGYDSAGLALCEEEVKVFKALGKVADLEKIIDQSNATCGIGHTRWATHGKPSVINCHPHVSPTGRFTIVHNGVIENYAELKNNVEELVSSTDTEVIAHLIEKNSLVTETVLEAIKKTMDTLEGSYALAVIDSHDTDVLYVVKNKSPLLIGKGVGFNIIGSDAIAMASETNHFYELNDKECAVISRDDVVIYDGKVQVGRETITIDVDTSDLGKGEYEHYMIKEISEQGGVIRNIISNYKNGIEEDIVKEIKDANRVYIIAAGTSYHAGLIGKNYLEKLANKPTEVHIASEFVYNMPLIDEKPLFIFVSQSGETADLRACLVKIKENNWKSLTITNVDKSTLAREADYSMLLHAGIEISVASTKAYTAQLAVLALIASHAGDCYNQTLSQLSLVANGIDNIFAARGKIKDIAINIMNGQRTCFFIGRSLDSLTSLEAALKLKEITYIQTEGFAAGELKHGTIALIEEGTPVIGLITQSNVSKNTRNNLEEVKSRGATIITIATKDVATDEDTIVIDSVDDLFAPIISVVPCQLMAYYVACARNLDVDMPRNLAKSVTVE